MKVGDLVVERKERLGHESRVGMVVALTEPTVLFSYQIATVQFANGEMRELVASRLYIISKENKN